MSMLSFGEVRLGQLVDPEMLIAVPQLAERSSLLGSVMEC